MSKEKRFSPLFYNPVTYVGVFLALLVFLLECFLFVVDFFTRGSNVYGELITYILLPSFLILGLILIPLGAFWKNRRVKRGLEPLHPKPIKIDLSVPAHRNAIFVFITGTFIVVVMSLVGSYKGFQYSESVEFCGTLCHQVMHPEFTSYLNSPHAKVKCVACHIGAGADWYVRAKLSGVRQVVRTLSGTYHRPIQTPVKNLRPAEETCKQCHWPGKYFSTMDFNRTYFLTEGENPEWRLRMLMNVGGGGDQSHGVHAHMNMDKDIFYVADDEKRQKISWIKSVDKEGRETIFTSPGSKYKSQPPPAELVRKMDCIDCHNRPTHQFLAPDRLVNQAMQGGAIDPGIPEIKKKSLEVLSKDYSSQEEAMKEIRRSIEEYYATKHAEYYALERSKVDGATDTLTRIFSGHIFPEMKVRWDTHPDNIGHLNSDGCFRCHDGGHKSVEGRLVTKDCNACHKIVEQGPAGAVEKNLEGLEFRHPGNVEDWKELACADCHTGGA